MNGFSRVSEQLARDTIAERVQTAQRSRPAGPTASTTSRRTRRGAAVGLRRLADRLDG